MTEPREIPLNAVPQYSHWPQRLMALEAFPIRYKTEQEVLREFNTEKWGMLLQQVRSQEYVTLAAVEQLESDFEAIDLYFEHQTIWLASVRYAWQRHLDLYQEVLAPYAAGASSLVELGAGYGSKLFNLAQHQPFANLPLFAAEYTTHGRELIKLLGDRLGRPVSVGYCDFRELSLSNIEIPENSLIFTSYAVHYVPELAQQFAEFLAQFRPKVVVHFEPCFEYLNENTLHHLMCKRYSLLNDYTRNLMTVLQASERKGTIQILNTRKNVIGINPFLPISVIEWTPR